MVAVDIGVIRALDVAATEMMVAAVKGNVTRVEGAPAEDRVRLERVSTDASCD